jgi:hypothetical protein
LKRVSSWRNGGIHGNPAENEDILTIVLPAKVFIDRVYSGEINDLKTLIAGYWFRQTPGLSRRLDTAPHRGDTVAGF